MICETDTFRDLKICGAPNASPLVGVAILVVLIVLAVFV